MEAGGVLVYGVDAKEVEVLSRSLTPAISSDRLLVRAVLMGEDASREAVGLSARLVSEVFVIEDPRLGKSSPENLSQALAALAEACLPDLIVLAAVPPGREIAARTATRLRTGCVSGCRGVRFEEAGGVRAEREIFGGLALAEFAFRSRPAVVTMEITNPAPLSLDADQSAPLTTFTVALEPVAKEVKDIRAKENVADLSAAQRIVAFGRGVASKEDIPLIRELAEALGAEIACSRPIAEDLGWLSVQHQVGLTGTTVRPKLYLAIGISGQVQHIAGIRDAQVIVAINSDPTAPIFQVADFGIVGDLYEVVPALVGALKGLSRKGA